MKLLTPIIKALGVSLPVFVFFLSVTLAPASSQAKDNWLAKPEKGDNGLYIQPWFVDGFLDLREELEQAEENDKQFVVFWEQAGCSYCKKMHEINLRIPGIVSYITENFRVIQLDMRGSRQVTDVDGEALSEKKLARKYGILYTPTIQFFPKRVKEINGKTGKDAEAKRFIGYLPPLAYLNAFFFTYEKIYETNPDFISWYETPGGKLTFKMHEGDWAKLVNQQESKAQ